MDSFVTKKSTQFLNKDDGLASVADVAMKPVFFPSRRRSFDYQMPRQPHFLENCFLCRKHIGGNKDIYMYRGDTPFCSEECRQEQIETDEAKENEKKWNKSLRKTQKKSTSSSTKKSQGYPFRIGTVIAA